MKLRTRTRVTLSWLCAVFTGAALAAGNGEPAIPSDDGRLDGDHLRLRVNVSGFQPVGGAAGKTFCAPAGSRLSVTFTVKEETALVRFLAVADEKDLLTFEADKPALAACPTAQRVNTFTQYSISLGTLRQHDFRRTGVTFGGLLVPFKYRLGGAKELVSSSSVAPFIGFRTGWMQGFGVMFTPVVAAGLSLVPVAKDGTTSTSAAYTFALGLRLTSSKNDAFSAGLIYGRDFLNKADREADPNVKKPWLSFYVGYAI